MKDGNLSAGELVVRELSFFWPKAPGAEMGGNTIRFDKTVVAFQGMCFILFLDLKLASGSRHQWRPALLAVSPLLWSHPCPKQIQHEMLNGQN